MEPGQQQELQTQIAASVPSLLQLSEADLLVSLGRQLDDTSYFNIPGQEGYTRAATRFLAAHRGLRETVCRAANHKVIDDTLSKTNITALASLVIPVFFSQLPPPDQAGPFLAALAIAILRIGLNEYCSGASERSPGASAPT